MFNPREFPIGAAFSFVCKSDRDLTGATLTLNAAASLAAVSPMLTLTSGSGITVTNAAAGEFTVSLLASQVDRFVPGVYEYTVDASGELGRIMIGTWTVTKQTVPFVNHNGPAQRGIAPTTITSATYAPVEWNCNAPTSDGGTISGTPFGSYGPWFGEAPALMRSSPWTAGLFGEVTIDHSGDAGHMRLDYGTGSFDYVIAASGSPTSSAFSFPLDDPGGSPLTITAKVDSAGDTITITRIRLLS